MFEFSDPAIGCTNMIPPDDAWLKRSGNQVVIGCYLSQQTWQLTCDGHEWKGQVGACPETCEFSTLTNSFVRIYLRNLSFVGKNIRPVQ